MRKEESAEKVLCDTSRVGSEERSEEGGNKDEHGREGRGAEA